MSEFKKGPSRVMGPEDGESYWQPFPHQGYMTVKVGPGVEGDPDPGFAFGIQVMPPGCHVREHGHARNTEVLFIYEGTGYAEIDGVREQIGPGTTILLGRFCGHTIVNEGKTDMKFAWFFTPPGLDQVVRAMGVPRKLGDQPPESFQRPPNVADILQAAGWATPEQIAASSRE
jgi:mannose-6-phosphate isomerase-like protein (cupin superfamily)